MSWERRQKYTPLEMVGRELLMEGVRYLNKEEIASLSLDPPQRLKPAPRPFDFTPVKRSYAHSSRDKL